jgi:hypothetical protein
MSLRSKVTIFNAALLRSGYAESVEAEGSAMWRAMDASYDEIVRSAFEEGGGSYPFGKRRVELTSRAAGDFGFDDSYTMGNDVIHVIEVFLDLLPASSLLAAWETKTEDGASSLQINASSRTVEIEYVASGMENSWTAGFTLGIQRRLEAVIKDVDQETEEANSKERDADFAFLRTQVKSSKNRSKSRLFRRGLGRLSRSRWG